MGATMNCYRTLRRIPRVLLCNGFAIAVALTLTLLPTTPATAAEDAPSAADQACLGCHGSAGMEKKLADGDVLKLQVPGELFGKSVHRANGCTSCHSDIDAAAHPPSKKDIKNARSYSIAAAAACKGCHAEKFEQYNTSIHAALARAGNPAAPICTDCHNPHGVIKGAITTLEGTPCKSCHKEIFSAYLGSVHAQSRQKSADSYAPGCSGCHSAHEVKPTSAGQGPEAACAGCHAGILEKHKAWLPNAALHFESVSCPACHVPSAHRKVELMLMDAQASKARGTEQIGVPLFDASTRSDGKGIDALTLWNLLQTFNREGVQNRTIVRGTLKVDTGPQAHQLADKSKAISDCHTCHRQNSEAFQKVTISLVGPDGRRVGYGANADVLSSVISVDSVRGFYAIGGTRIWLLDILLVLAILGGIAIAVGHLFLGWFFKRFGFYHPHNGGHVGGDDTPKAS